MCIRDSLWTPCGRRKTVRRSSTSGTSWKLSLIHISIGHIGYYYPAEVWISEYGKLYAKYAYQDEIECFPDVFALIERELRQCKFDSAAMKTVEAPVSYTHLDVYKRQLYVEFCPDCHIVSMQHQQT